MFLMDVVINDMAMVLNIIKKYTENGTKSLYDISL